MTEREQWLNLSPPQRAIVRLLKEWGKGTVAQLSKMLGLSRVAVHYHLRRLKAQGVVQGQVERRGRGRPRVVFRLTQAVQEHLFPRRYDMLATVMLDEIVADMGREYVRKLFQRYRQRLLARFNCPRAPLAERVRALTQLLADEGYMAYSEEASDGFVITLPNCPIAEVVRQFHEACDSELEVLATVLDAPVVRKCHQAAGDPCCRYFVAKTTKPAKEVVRQ
ncbi:hypothetical protein HRbin17_00808 [bacterium HR17]|uniref:HTH arsR-type domain-containing protein n=1 Tax=Candidatus Fervidibacter japonicus TaxID=2035412 RepID=A0A2H5XAT9_9BACT|nr:hypothetical protein HRbin17_00808 [bacterium HR17]